LRIGNWRAVVGILVAVGAISASWRTSVVSASGSGPAALTDRDPNAACAGCHQSIYKQYRETPMARASGSAADGFLPADFTHPASGVTYQLVEKDGQVLLKFSREASAGSGADDGKLRGERQLRYFLGSGTRGRTYLFEQDGYWFELPINWYAKKRIWDMAPNYQNAREMPLTLPVDPGCLRCHSSDAQVSLPEARNKYAGAPFLAGGITCTACHGDASAHLASGGRTAMIKIDALPTVQRDSVCLSCHLEGQQAVVHEGKRMVDFRPGQSIFDYASFFVRQADAGSGAEGRATSQWEALLKSGCKRGAGERLTCTSCHDPHSSTVGMSATDRISFYRNKCLQCHDVDAARQSGGLSGGHAPPEAQKDFAATHHVEDQDCAACHMPRLQSEDIAHEQVTDHSIPRVGNSASRASALSKGALIAVGASPGVPGASSDRDLGLAYAFAASRGDREAGERAIPLLVQAEAQPGAQEDATLHEQLGFLRQLGGRKDSAAQEYRMALAADPHDAVAAGDLALLEAGDRHYAAAVSLWERAFAEDPVQLKAGMNLAIVQCGLGRKEAALETLQRILAFSPDDHAARELNLGIRSGNHSCGVRSP
jgi:tetratricopeptide (TPR) repeat protein